MKVKPPGPLVIYQEAGRPVEVRLDTERDTVWLSQDQMTALFGRERSVITKHITNLFREHELDETSNVQNLHIAGSDKPVKIYSLDVIISVGYRVKSQQGIRFRQWATRTLRQHLIQGWTLHQQRFEANARELEAAMALVRITAQSPALDNKSSRGLVDILAHYMQAFLLLERYDQGLLTEPPTQSGGCLPTVDEARRALGGLKADLMARGMASDLFALERGDGLAALWGNLEQTVFGKPAYPSLEAKAAHLLYFVVKNHPFVDGNKRSAAFLFVDLLNRNGRLFDSHGEVVINDLGLAALTLLVAESSAENKEVMIRLVMNMLCQKKIHERSRDPSRTD